MFTQTVAPRRGGVVLTKQAHWFDVTLVQNGNVESMAHVIAYNRDEAKRAVVEDRGWPLHRIRAKRAQRSRRVLEAVTA